MQPRRTIGTILVVFCLLWASSATGLPGDEPDVATPPALALLLWQQGYALHLIGRYELATKYFRKSIEVYPTAEAHTFLGWSLSYLGQIEEAIDECKTAIDLDPDYGNPYNDIGVYLIDLGRIDEAIPWLEKATLAKRYCCYEFPHFNLGRVHLMKGRLLEARRSLERALDYEPNYLPAQRALEYIRAQGQDL
jgi:tetratricopeptide (TPR) repeat protein